MTDGRAARRHQNRLRRVRARVSLQALGLSVASVALLGGLLPAAASSAHGRRAPHVHFACSSKDAAKVPCRFSTPSGNVHCQWLPSTGAVTCELLSNGRGFVLAPAGKARAVRPHLGRRGEALPTTQQLVFPRGLSCHDTAKTMTCNQDFARGAFKLGASHH